MWNKHILVHVIWTCISLSFGASGRLRFMIVAFPGYSTCILTCHMKKNKTIKLSSAVVVISTSLRCIGPDKRGYPDNTFFTSPEKHMLWVLIRNASLRHF